MSDLSNSLDAAQLLMLAFDSTTNKIKVDASISPAGGATEVVITHVDDSIKIGDGVNFLSINGDGSIKLPTGIATSAKQDTGNTSIASVDSKLPSLLSSAPVSDTGQAAIPVRIISQLGAGSGGGSSGGLTDTELRATPVPVSGTVIAQDGGGSITVDGTVSISGTVPVSGPLTDAQLRAAAVQVSGTVAVTGAYQATQPVSIASMPATPVTDNGGSLTVDGSVSISNFPASQAVTGPLTDAELRATPVPVSGTITANAGSGTFAVSAASLPLPASASQEHVTAASPHATRLSDGTSFYKATTPSDTQPVSVAGTVAVSGPLTDTQLRATAVPVSIAASVAVTGPLTDTQLRASSVPVSVSSVTKVALTPASPTAATVGITSASAVASNSSRKGLILTNTSSNVISFGLGATAVLNSGITLNPGGVWVMDEYTFCTSAINAIASVASSNLAIQEFS